MHRPRRSLFIGATFFTGAALSHLYHVSSRETEREAIQRRQFQLETAFQNASAERDLLSNRIDGISAQKHTLEQEVSALRVKIGSLSSTQREKTAAVALDTKDTPFSRHVGHLIGEAASLDQLFTEHPQRAIPELAKLTAGDWLKVTESADLQSEDGLRKAMSEARRAGKKRFLLETVEALKAYQSANSNQFPPSTAALEPYFKADVDRSALARYQVRQLPEASSDGQLAKGQMVLDEMAPVDHQFDSHFYVTAQSFYSFVYGTGYDSGDPDKTWMQR
jgi:hypothetical protein